MIEQHIRQYLLNRVKAKTTATSNGCILWTGTKNKGGYGLIRFTTCYKVNARSDEQKLERILDRWSGEHTPQIEDKTPPSSPVPVHRAVYMAHHNTVLAPDMQVLHSCDNPACCNIEHLFIGTSKDNSLDMLSKGRNAKTYRKHIRQRVYTPEEIEAIRTAPGKLSDLAVIYGASTGYISKLRNGKAKNLL